MSGYLERLTRHILQPVPAVRPLAGSVFSPLPRRRETGDPQPHEEELFSNSEPLFAVPESGTQHTAQPHPGTRIQPPTPRAMDAGRTVSYITISTRARRSISHNSRNHPQPNAVRTDERSRRTSTPTRTTTAIISTRRSRCPATGLSPRFGTILTHAPGIHPKLEPRPQHLSRIAAASSAKPASSSAARHLR